MQPTPYAWPILTIGGNMPSFPFNTPLAVSRARLKLGRSAVLSNLSLSIEKGLVTQQRAVHSHIITSRYGAPLMVKRRQGLIVEIADGADLDYRGNLFYDLAKVSALRLAFTMAEELRPHEGSPPWPSHSASCARRRCWSTSG